MAIRDRTIYVLGSPQLLDGQVRVYFDIESDPEEGYVYLIGLLVCDGEAETPFLFWANDKSQELLILDQFLDVLSRTLRQPGAKPAAAIFAVGLRRGFSRSSLCQAATRLKVVRSADGWTLKYRVLVVTTERPGNNRSAIRSAMSCRPSGSIARDFSGPDWTQKGRIPASIQ